MQAESGKYAPRQTALEKRHGAAVMTLQEAYRAHLADPDNCPSNCEVLNAEAGTWDCIEADDSGEHWIVCPETAFCSCLSLVSTCPHLMFVEWVQRQTAQAVAAESLAVEALQLEQSTPEQSDADAHAGLLAKVQENLEVRSCSQ